jgi:hypothetical protein
MTNVGKKSREIFKRKRMKKNRFGKDGGKNNMKNQLVIIGIVALLVCVGLSGCEDINKNINPEKNKFVGTWINSTSPYTTINLLSDGTCSYSSYSGTWDLKNGKLVFDLMSDTTPFTFTYYYIFSDNDRTLTLSSISGGLSRIYTKQ